VEERPFSGPHSRALFAREWVERRVEAPKRQALALVQEQLRQHAQLWNRPHSEHCPFLF